MADIVLAVARAVAVACHRGASRLGCMHAKIVNLADNLVFTMIL